jgi:hypothetical protein
MSPFLGVVPHVQPTAILQPDHIGTGTRVRDQAVLHRTPGRPPILRLGHQEALGRWTVVPHVGHQRPILPGDDRGLDVPSPHQRRAGRPSGTGIIRVREEGGGKPVVIERNQDPAAGVHRRPDDRIADGDLDPVRLSALEALIEEEEALEKEQKARVKAADRRSKDRRRPEVAEFDGMRD